jgi:hypothetical protein
MVVAVVGWLVGAVADNLQRAVSASGGAPRHACIGRPLTYPPRAAPTAPPPRRTYDTRAATRPTQMVAIPGASNMAWHPDGNVVAVAGVKQVGGRGGWLVNLVWVAGLRISAAVRHLEPPNLAAAQPPRPLTPHPFRPPQNDVSFVDVRKGTVLGQHVFHQVRATRGGERLRQTARSLAAAAFVVHVLASLAASRLTHAHAPSPLLSSPHQTTH